MKFDSLGSRLGKPSAPTDSLSMGRRTKVGFGGRRLHRAPHRAGVGTQAVAAAPKPAASGWSTSSPAAGAISPLCSSSTRSRSPAFMNSQLPGVPAPAPSATPTWATVRRVRRRRAGRVEHLKPSWFQGTAGGPVSGGPRRGSGRCVPPNRPRLMSQPGLEARRVVDSRAAPSRSRRRGSRPRARGRPSQA